MEVKKIEAGKPIMELQFVRLKPEIGEPVFRESLLLNKCKQLAWDYDKAHNSLLYDLILSLRKFEEVTDNLRVCRQAVKSEYIKNDQQWKELQNKETALRQSFIKFEQFVNENVDKRKRTLKKIEDEKAMQEQRVNMIAELKEQQIFILNIKGRFEQKIREYRMYDDFLNRVVADSGQFRSIEGLIKRYQSLVETKQEIGMKRDREMDQLDQDKQKIIRIIDNKKLEMLGLNMQLTELYVRYIEAKNKSIHWESIVETVKNVTIAKEREISSVRIGMRQMYEQMCERSGTPKKIPFEDFENQLSHISSALFLIKKSIAVVNKVMAMEGASVEKHKSAIKKPQMSLEYQCSSYKLD